MMRKLIFAALLLLAALPARAALSIVQAVSNQSAAVGTAGVVVTIATTNGNLLVVASYQDAGGITMSVTDSASQTWTQAGSTVNGGTSGQLGMFYKPGSAVVSSVTVKWSTSSSITMAATVYEISGAASSTPLDSNGSNPATSTGAASATSLASGSLNTSNTNDVLLYAVGEQTTSSGWADTVNGFAIQSGGSGTQREGMAFKIVSATQSGATTTMSWTTSGGDRCGILAAFADTNQGVSQIGVNKREKYEQLDPQSR